MVAIFLNLAPFSIGLYHQGHVHTSAVYIALFTLAAMGTNMHPFIPQRYFQVLPIVEGKFDQSSKVRF
jgi:hypothetical protein